MIFTTHPVSLSSEYDPLIKAIENNNSTYEIKHDSQKNEWYMEISGETEDIFYIKLKFDGEVVE